MTSKALDTSLIAVLSGRGTAATKIAQMEKLWTPPSLGSHRGGHAYVHPTALCPVACRHCMYSSTLEHEGKAWLTPSDTRALVETLRGVAPAKLTFSGGGEPFLMLALCIEVMQGVTCDRVEFVTAANWATSPARANAALRKIADAAAPGQRVTIRLSVDSFHWDAPRPVPFANYVRIIEAFRDPFIESRLELAFRSLLRERAVAEKRFVAEASATVTRVDDWNSRLTFSGGHEAAITYNVMRFSGAAAANELDRVSEDVGVVDYFGRLAGLPDLKVSNALNDASVGAYTSDAGAAFTFDYDATYFIFGATPPDWRGHLRASLEDNLRLFALDPITQYALSHGAEGAMRLMNPINPARVARAMATEDIAALIPTAFADDRERAAARLLAIAELTRKGAGAAKCDIALLVDAAQSLQLAGT